MRKIILSSIVALGSLSLFAQSNTQYINTFVGSIKMGHTFPGACVPHGIVQLSPDTDTIAHNINGVYQTDVYKYCAGYQYSDSTIVGFSHTHLSGTGHSDLGDILIMPFTGEVQFNPGTSDNPDSGYRSRFDHSTESSQAGYYAVTLSDDDIKAELTATSRVGVHRYSYPSGATPKILLDLTHGIYNYDGKVLWSQLRVENDTLLTGYRITNGWSRTNYTYFAISLSKPIVSYGADDRKSTKYNGWWRKFDISKGFPEMGAPKLVAFFEFEDDGKPLELKVALSAVSTNGALANLEAEALNHTFDYLVADAHNRWAEEIDIIEVEGSDEKKTMLYTSLYHTLINPSEYMDVTGEYRGVDHNIHKSNDFVNYTIFSLWDTYRTLHPLYTLLNRERNSDIVESMLSHHDQSVHKALPIWSHMGNENWCMIGYHGVSVVGDMAIKDDNSIDKKRALDAMINSSNVGYYDGIDFYKENGYVPYEINSSGSSITLEYAYDDWVIYYLASKIGDTHTSQQYKERAYNYKNVYDKSIGFARARLSNGQWKEDVNLLNTHWQGFIEGNSWNYSFYVPHDVNGMIELMGGDERFVSRLDSLFTMELPHEYFESNEDITKEGLMGNYVHGNEPSHHIAYLYNWSSQPWKTQYWVREIMNNMYKSGIDGLCGNDDCGQMSAWYVFSSMGFYPVCPATNEYVLGAPYFPYMKVKMSSGKHLEIIAKGVSDKNRYVKSVKLNGNNYDKAYITYDDIANGAILEFEMSSKPNKHRLFNNSQKPYSLTTYDE